jgi:hypothetical protein
MSAFICSSCLLRASIWACMSEVVAAEPPAPANAKAGTAKRAASANVEIFFTIPLSPF